MRTTIATIVVSTVLCAGVSADGMTAGDRQRLLAHLEMTESWLASEVANLSEAQLRFRMRPEAWSITDVVEHLSTAEPQSGSSSKTR